MKHTGAIIFLLLTFGACQTRPPSALLLRFSEHDAGGQPYETRMLLDRALLQDCGAGGAGERSAAALIAVARTLGLRPVSACCG